jgi:hypothetical protein
MEVNMYKVVLNSETKSKSFSKTFSEYSPARNYANRLFHKRYTLSIREQGYPADDFIVFNKPIFSETEEIVVYNSQESFSLSITKTNKSESDTNPPDDKSSKTGKPEITVKPSNDKKIISSRQQYAFDRKIYSIKDHVDSIHLRQLLMTKMLESSPVCQQCGKPLTSKQNTTIKKIDKRIGFTRNNCFLKHKECRTNDIRTNIQFIYSE